MESGRYELGARDSFAQVGVWNEVSGASFAGCQVGFLYHRLKSCSVGVLRD